MIDHVGSRRNSLLRKPCLEYGCGCPTEHFEGETVRSAVCQFILTRFTGPRLRGNSEGKGKDGRNPNHDDMQWTRRNFVPSVNEEVRLLPGETPPPLYCATSQGGQSQMDWRDMGRGVVPRSTREEPAVHCRAEHSTVLCPAQNVRMDYRWLTTTTSDPAADTNSPSEYQRTFHSTFLISPPMRNRWLLLR